MAEHFFTAVFVAEMLVKHAAYGLVEYWSTPQLIFDGGEVSDVAERDLAAFIETVAQGYARPFRSPKLRRPARS